MSQIIRESAFASPSDSDLKELDTDDAGLGYSPHRLELPIREYHLSNILYVESRSG